MDSDHWVVGMKPDDPLGMQKNILQRDDLIDKPLYSSQKDETCRANLPTGLVGF